MSAEHNPYITLEEQYQAAGWQVAYQLMGEFGRKVDENPRLKTSVVGKYTLELCERAFKQPHEVVPRIKERMRLDRGKIVGSYGNVFTDVSGTQIDPALELMHGLKYDLDEVILDVLKVSHFDRFDQDIAHCTEFYSSRISDDAQSGANIGPAIKTIQRDSAFYIGMYDTQSTD